MHGGTVPAASQSCAKSDKHPENGIFLTVGAINEFGRGKIELEAAPNHGGDYKKTCSDQPRWRSDTGALHPYVNTGTRIPAQLRAGRSYQLSKLCLFNFLLPSGTFTSPKCSAWRKETLLRLTLPQDPMDSQEQRRAALRFFPRLIRVELRAAASADADPLR